MGDNRNSDLLSRYEKMLRGEANSYFDTEEFYDIASEYEYMGYMDDALRAVENGLRFHPNTDILLAKRARYLLSLDRVDEAREMVIRVRIDNEDSFFVKVGLLFNDSDFEGGIAKMRLWLEMPDITADRCIDALELSSDYEVVDLSLPMILKYAERLPVRQRRDMLEDFLSILEEDGYMKERCLVYEKILDMEPFSGNYWREAFWAYMDAGNYAKAVEAIDYAIAVSPDDSSLLCEKADCLFRMGDFRRAADIISKNISRMEDKSYPYEILAGCFTNMGNCMTSDRVLDIAQEIYPDNYKYWYLRAENRLYSDDADYNKCIEYLKYALRISPDDENVSLLLAKVYFKMEKYSDARALLGRLIDLNKADAKVYMLLGDVELKAGFPDMAIGYYKKALEFETFNADAFVKLVNAYSQVEDVENMIKAIDELELLIDSEQVKDGINSDETVKGAKDIRKAIELIKSMLRNGMDDMI